jgi:predicted RNA methylase
MYGQERQGRSTFPPYAAVYNNYQAEQEFLAVPKAYSKEFKISRTCSHDSAEWRAMFTAGEPFKFDAARINAYKANAAEEEKTMEEDEKEELDAEEMDANLSAPPPTRRSYHSEKRTLVHARRGEKSQEFHRAMLLRYVPMTGGHVLDLCAGTGSLALATRNFPGVTVESVEIDPFVSGLAKDRLQRMWSKARAVAADKSAARVPPPDSPLGNALRNPSAELPPRAGLQILYDYSHFFKTTHALPAASCQCCGQSLCATRESADGSGSITYERKAQFHVESSALKHRREFCTEQCMLHSDQLSAAKASGGDFFTNRCNLTWAVCESTTVVDEAAYTATTQKLKDDFLAKKRKAALKAAKAARKTAAADSAEAAESDDALSQRVEAQLEREWDAAMPNIVPPRNEIQRFVPPGRDHHPTASELQSRLQKEIDHLAPSVKVEDGVLLAAEVINAGHPLCCATGNLVPVTDWQGKGSVRSTGKLSAALRCFIRSLTLLWLLSLQPRGGLS